MGKIFLRFKFLNFLNLGDGHAHGRMDKYFIQ